MKFLKTHFLSSVARAKVQKSKMATKMAAKKYKIPHILCVFIFSIYYQSSRKKFAAFGWARTDPPAPRITSHLKL